MEQVVRGTENILWTLHHQLPDARIVVVSVLPRERERAEWIRQVNIHVRQFAPSVKAGSSTSGPSFAEEDGELDPRYTEDRVHVNEAGYARLGRRAAPAPRRLTRRLTRRLSA